MIQLWIGSLGKSGNAILARDCRSLGSREHDEEDRALVLMRFAENHDAENHDYEQLTEMFGTSAGAYRMQIGWSLGWLRPGLRVREQVPSAVHSSLPAV
jgi:hypothetical protein